jgi:uncharacterized protein with HEPN domain
MEDITASCDKILSYTSGMSFEAFMADDRTYDAVLLNLQIIGESVKNLPQEIRDRAPDVEWRKIAGLRDIIAHAYFQIEGSIIWDVVQTKIKHLHQSVQTILNAGEFG